MELFKQWLGSLTLVRSPGFTVRTLHLQLNFLSWPESSVIKNLTLCVPQHIPMRKEFFTSKLDFRALLAAIEDLQISEIPLF